MVSWVSSVFRTLCDLGRGGEISKTRNRERPGILGAGRNLMHGSSVFIKGEAENLREKDLPKAIQRVSSVDGI